MVWAGECELASDLTLPAVRNTALKRADTSPIGYTPWFCVAGRREAGSLLPSRGERVTS